MRFVGLALHDTVPDAKTIWLYREQLTRAGALARLFARFDAVLAEHGFLAMGGQIVDATLIEARRPRLTKEEKATLRAGGMPEGWSKARARQIDRDGHWTLNRLRKFGSLRRRDMIRSFLGHGEGDGCAERTSRRGRCSAT
jgi:transposase, IS5 family